MWVPLNLEEKVFLEPITYKLRTFNELSLKEVQEMLDSVKARFPKSWETLSIGVSLNRHPKDPWLSITRIIPDLPRVKLNKEDRNKIEENQINFLKKLRGVNANNPSWRELGVACVRAFLGRLGLSVPRRGDGKTQQP